VFEVESEEAFENLLVGEVGGPAVGGAATAASSVRWALSSHVGRAL